MVLAAMSGVNQLIARLLYGSGLRLIECLRLRIIDVDFDHRQITVRNPKGKVDHLTMLPDSLVAPLQEHLQHVKKLHRRDLDQGYGTVYLPDDLEQDHPNAHRKWRWQYVFPAARRSTDPRSGAVRRHHLGASGPQKAVRKAALSIAIPKRITCRTLRHCFATHLLENGYDTPGPLALSPVRPKYRAQGQRVRTVQELMGHKGVNTTMVYTRILDHNVRSPLD